MKSTNKAFTLVELIVVITILAILGTIAFISLQGYSSDARNSKRISDLGNIQSAITLKGVEGVPLMSFVTENDDNPIDLIALGWFAASTPAVTAYNAGTPNFAVLNVVAKDFKDPNGGDYAVGATTIGWDRFQVAATMEADGTNTTKINGTYSARTAKTILFTVVDADTLKMESTGANWFKAGDSVTIWETAYEVDGVSRDGMQVTLTTGHLQTAGGNIQLSTAETGGLISDGASGSLTNSFY